ncbi:hypothetical protein WOLCODRAFT_131199 [Wolfiporia cocos MD-104 SS10]|uniref:Uncharacterized protein n=1 Tax=Wolfiporia cocos (strain MD-104) TaxID=742152 RepID=A0A2H3JCZ5_WOLCO|nr:hypothetical protein WOLCODRAFT_131199 [Wolfiporia cocos MD-104 SS10]
MDSKNHDTPLIAEVPTLESLKGNPFLPPQDERCLINQLPAEILAHIFLLGTVHYDSFDDDDDDDDAEDENWISEDSSDDSDDSDEDNVVEDGEPEFEVLVSRVCRHWREVALSTPALWTTIDFSGDSPFERAREYLQRSKNAPLDISVDITLDFDDEPEEEEEDDLSKILPLIMPHVGHWRAIELAVSEYPLMHAALIEMGNCPAAPMLEVLQLYHYEDDDDVDYDSFKPAAMRHQDFVLFHGNAPRLTHVALWGVHLDWDASHFLSGLIDFELAYHTRDVRPSFAQFARILRESPDIDTLTVCRSGPVGGPVDWLASVLGCTSNDLTREQLRDTAGPEADTTITLPSLKSLVFALLPTDYANNLIQRLALPNIESLALDLEEECSEFLRTVSRPSLGADKSLLSVIQGLKVSGASCNDKKTIEDAYGAMRNVTSLNINFCHTSQLWYTLLVDGGPTRLPRLKALSTTGVNGADMRKLVEARKAAGVPLERVFMNEEDEIEDEDEEWLHKNVQDFELFEGSDDEDVMDDDIELAEEEGEDEDDEWEDIQ